MRMAILILLMVSFSFQVADAQSQKPEPKWSMSGLEIADYKAVPLSIKGQGLEIIGLTEGKIRAECELRLRQANLNAKLVTPESTFLPSLYVSVHVVGAAFRITVKFDRLVSYKADGQEYETMGTTWEEGLTGTHGGNPEYVIRGLDQGLENFLNEYLKVNAK